MSSSERETRVVDGLRMPKHVNRALLCYVFCFSRVGFSNGSVSYCTQWMMCKWRAHVRGSFVFLSVSVLKSFDDRNIQHAGQNFCFFSRTTDFSFIATCSTIKFISKILSTLPTQHIYYSHSLNFEKPVLTSSCLSGCLSVSVHPSVRMEQLGSQWTNFDETWYLRLFLKPFEKIQALLKSDKNNGYFTWKPIYIYDNTSLNSS